MGAENQESCRISFLLSDVAMLSLSDSPIQIYPRVVCKNCLTPMHTTQSIIVDRQVGIKPEHTSFAQTS